MTDYEFGLGFYASVTGKTVEIVSDKGPPDNPLIGSSYDVKPGEPKYISAWDYDGNPIDGNYEFILRPVVKRYYHVVFADSISKAFDTRAIAKNLATRKANAGHKVVGLLEVVLDPVGNINCLHTKIFPGDLR